MLATFVSSLGDIAASHCKNWGQNLREQYGSACVLFIHIICTSGVVCIALRLGERPKWTAGRSERFELRGSSRQNKCTHTPKMHTVQNKLAALKKRKKGGRGVVIHFITLSTLLLCQIPHWNNRFPIFLLKIKGLFYSHLWSCIKAHKAHAEVNCKSHKVTLHDASIRFTLQNRKTRCYPHRHTPENVRRASSILVLKQLSWNCMLDWNHHNSLHAAYCSGSDLYPLHLQESGHLKSLFPGQQLTVQLHAEKHVLSTLSLDTEAVLPLVQKVVILG